MSPERALHTRLKYRVWRELSDALEAGGVDGEVLGDGMSIRVDESTIYEPDALVRLGNPVGDDIFQVSDPVVLVEVLSPSSRGLDAGGKLADYFRLPSVAHYLIVNGWNSSVTHHARRDDGRIESRVLSTGSLDLYPLGMKVAVESFFQR
jgi:Uma2 family endonuclease